MGPLMLTYVCMIEDMEAIETVLSDRVVANVNAVKMNVEDVHPSSHATLPRVRHFNPDSPNIQSMLGANRADFDRSHPTIDHRIHELLQLASHDKLLAQMPFSWMPWL